MWGSGAECRASVPAHPRRTLLPPVLAAPKAEVPAPEQQADAAQLAAAQSVNQAAPAQPGQAQGDSLQVCVLAVQTSDCFSIPGKHKNPAR